uniref:BPTI/Kunitz inhibitor domain-containing protein n=1 Tax=Setaria digitata TaxID=48799 RepID=A0A915PRI6_9BILA
MRIHGEMWQIRDIWMKLARDVDERLTDGTFQDEMRVLPRTTRTTDTKLIPVVIVPSNIVGEKRSCHGSISRAIQSPTDEHLEGHRRDNNLISSKSYLRNIELQRHALCAVKNSFTTQCRIFANSPFPADEFSVGQDLPRTTTSAVPLTPRRLLIKTRYINDLTTASLTRQSVTTAVPSTWLTNFTTLLSQLSSEIITTTTTDSTSITDTTTSAITAATATTLFTSTTANFITAAMTTDTTVPEATEVMGTTSTVLVTFEKSSSLTPDRTIVKQFTPMRKKLSRTKNPCLIGKPLKSKSGMTMLCKPSMKSNGGCPTNFWCHVGVNDQSTVCCPVLAEDRCKQPMLTGTGVDTTIRWYFNAELKYCLQFNYRGFRGNANNFVTQSECMETCVGESEEDRNPCKYGGPAKDSDERPIICNLANSTACPKGYFCHVGVSQEETACCEQSGIADPCSLPVEEGQGEEKLDRYYYNHISGGCLQFIYRGLKGNENNFPTGEMCVEKCMRKSKDPCSTGPMLLTPMNKPFFCSATNVCPQNYWCHIGANGSNVCCPENGMDRCEQPVVEGTGDKKLVRWYFDQALHKCSIFYYHGEGGNQNSFLTEDDCNNVCPTYENPCANGEPLLINNKPKICNPEERCPHLYYCHIGSDGEQNYCCHKNGDPCDQTMNQGEGGSLLLRYYYDKDTHRCREFVYHGVRGNANNFLSEADCEATCPVVPNPCKHGRPLTNVKNEPIICNGSESCPNEYFCHIGGAPETTNCCLGSRVACDLLVEVGKGFEQLYRWYFDRSEQMCRKLIYRGLFGNANNFISREACQQNCKGRNPCTQIRVVGYGDEAISRWFYDGNRKKCLEFNYSGAGGNENNFLSMESCEESCQERQDYCPHGEPLMEASGKALAKCGVTNACPMGFICNINIEKNTTACCQDPANFCLQPMNPGQCKKFEIRYGYDPELDDCVSYQYGGITALVIKTNSVILAYRDVDVLEQDHSSYFLPKSELLRFNSQYIGHYVDRCKRMKREWDNFDINSLFVRVLPEAKIQWHQDFYFQ